MDQSSNSADIIEQASQIAVWLEAMSQPGEVSLTLEGQETSPLTVLLVEVHEAERLVIDVTATSEVASALTAERAFKLTGQAGGAMISTEAMAATPLNDIPGRLRFACDYPERLEIWHRRSDFRAELRQGMRVDIDLEAKGVDGVIHAELTNLSLGGCLARVPLAAAAMLPAGQVVSRLQATFPNGQQFSTLGGVRHVRIHDEEEGHALLGVEFNTPTPKLERLIWFLVKEIEREGARNALRDGSTLAPSPLFQGPPQATSAPPARRARADYATPMARRLAKVADYLNATLLQLQQGEAIDDTQLSRYSDQLLTLLVDDREALLFAIVCLHREPPLVQHSLAVAIRLADLLQARNIERERIKAVVAASLVHDLGKILLPKRLRESPCFDDQKRHALAEHVALIRDRLGENSWLMPETIDSVIGCINERLDGSGYPAGLRGDALSSLSRMAAVVDAIDAMSRPRADRSAWSLETIYRHLLTHGQTFDSECVQRYIRHFGLQPIGSLAQFSNGAQGWIQRLDERGLPRQVAVISPSAQLRVDSELISLGRIESLIAAPGPELLPQQ